MKTQSTSGREGDRVESRGEAGEDAGVEVEHPISTTSVVVGQEGVECHSLWRRDGIRLGGGLNDPQLPKT